MPNQPPYRMACEGVSGKPLFFFGGPFQHSLGPEKVDKYICTTTVPNWDTPPPATIAPYERWHDNSASAACEVNFCNPTGAPCVAWPAPYTANTFSHTPGDQVDFAVTHKKGFKNVQARRTWHGAFGWTSNQRGCPTTFCADGTSRTAYQAWPPDQTKYLTLTYDCHMRYSFPAGEDAGGYHNADLTGARTVNANTGEVTSTVISSETEAQNCAGVVTVTHSISGGAGFSGDCTSTTTYTNGQSTLLDTAYNCACGFPKVLPDDTPDLPAFINNWNAIHSVPMPALTNPNSYTCSVTSPDIDGVTYKIDVTWSRTNTTISFDFLFQSDEDVSGTFNQRHHYGTITWSNPNTSADMMADITALLNEWPLNDDHLYPWRTDLKVSIAPLVTRNELVNRVDPCGFNPYKILDLRDGTSLIPWLDPNVWFFTMPDGSLLAAGSAYTGTNASGLISLYDGSIVGAPLPAGYQKPFNFAFSDIRGCCNRPGDGSQNWGWYQLGWGQDVGTFNSNTGCSLPLNCTQWNNWPESINKPAGAWVIYADQAAYYPSDCVSSAGFSGAFDAGQIVAQKWAEILEGWNSENFARPAGDDKFAFDETRVYCATNVSGSGAGSTWNLADPTTGSAPPSGDIDLTALWGSELVGGFYNVTAYSGGVLTLGTKAYDLPTGWITRSNNDGLGCIGKLRYTSGAGVPPASLLGRVAITADMAGTTFTFASAQVNFGMNSSTHQEQVDLYDSTMTLLASNVTVTRTSDTTFTSLSSFPSSAFVTIHGVKYYWNDTSSKGDFLVLQFESDFRSQREAIRLTGVMDCDGVTPMALPGTITYTNADYNGGSATVTAPGNGFSKFQQIPACLPFRPCAPRVVCISPNCESFPNGITIPFPGATVDCSGNPIAHPAPVLLDEQYGYKTWIWPQTDMTSVFWQAPHRPCNILACDKWLQDDGTCNDPVETGGPCPDAPSTYYYEYPPLVEARATVPCNYGPGPVQTECAPALPSMIQIGWLSPVTNTTGDVAYPPLPPGVVSGGGIPGGAATAWDIHARLCGHAAGCRFNYKQPLC